MKIDIALETIQSEDVFKGIEYLNRQSNPSEVLDAYKEIVKRYYWESKDLANVVMISLAAIQYADILQKEAGLGIEETGEIQGKAASIAYNLASYTWPGWMEEGIELSAMEFKIGLEAAKLNLRLLDELKAEHIKLARAYWMTGAHRLTLQDADNAIYCFERSLKYADWADNKEETLLAQGFMVLAQMLQSDDNRASDEKLLGDLKAKLEDLPDGDAYSQQIDTAYNFLFQSK